MNELTSDVSRAAEILREGGVLAYPTEAVYGLGCDPRNEDTVHKLLRIKQRDPAKGLILIAAAFEQLTPYLATIDATMQERILSTWPGPVTLALPAGADVSAVLRGTHDTLAVRVTAHPLASALCRAFGGALVSTSANRSHQPPARRASDVIQLFGEQIDGTLAGDVGDQANPTEIRDGRTGALLRPS